MDESSFLTHSSNKTPAIQLFFCALYRQGSCFTFLKHLDLRSCQFVLILHPCRKSVFFGTPYFAATSLFVITLWARFLYRKEPRMVSLNSRRFVDVFKNQMHDSKTLECWNFSQKVRILLNNLGEIRKSSSCREKFI